MKNLANQIRPTSLDDIIGQNKIKRLLHKVIKKQIRSSFIFYGPSGVGKTTCALILAKTLNLKWCLYNATLENKKDLLSKIASNNVLIIDEFHRLPKQNQEILLSHLEQDQIIIFATTTENPYFKIIPSIRSRMSLLVFEKITQNDLVKAVKKINLQSKLNLILSENLIKSIVLLSNGDLRNTINNLELISLIYKNKTITFKDLQVILPNLHFTSDKEGDDHYNLLSAFHKSLRGSDVEASLYYSYRIIKSGDLDGFYRRIIDVTYEDIGLANALMDLKVNVAINAMERVGFPLANNIVAKIVTELALSPKSNSTYLAGSKWKKLVDDGNIYEVPNYLKDAHYQSASKLGHGTSYQYPHDFVNNYVEQQYLPKQLKNMQYFDFANNIQEKNIHSYWKKIRAKKDD